MPSFRIQRWGKPLPRLVTILTVLALLALAFALPRPIAAQGEARIRLVHAVPGAGPVDVFVSELVAAKSLTFANATRFLNAPSGELTVSVRAADSTTELLSVNVSLKAGQAKTIVLSGLQAVIASEFEDDLGPIAAGKTRLTAIHAIDGADPVDVAQTANGQLELNLITGLTYATAYGSVDIDAFAPEISVLPAGGGLEQTFAMGQFSMVSGTYNTLMVLGADSGEPKPQVVVLTAPLPSAEPDSGLLRLVHGNADVPAVDIYVNDTLVAPMIGYGEFTPHIGVPGQAITVSVRPAGTPPQTPPVLSGQVDLSAIKAQTIVVAGTGSAPAIIVSSDNTSPLPSTTSRIHLINAAPAAGVANLQIGTTTLRSDDAEIAGGVEIPATNTFISVGIDGTQIAASGPQSFVGGVLYDVIVGGTDASPLILFAETGLSEALGSFPTNPIGPEVVTQPTEAPATPTLSVAAMTEVPAVTATPAAVVAEPTLSIDQQVQTAVAATLAAVQVQPTAVQPTPVPVEPTAAPTDAPVVVVTTTPESAVPVREDKGIYGEVATDPGVNLKLREYPRDDARTLALAPSGTLLIVEGVKGPAEALANVPTTATPGPTATLSAEGVTVDQVWVFVVWQQPDGEITGWTKAQFLRITRDGLSIASVEKLFTFPLVPENRFGVVNSNLATPIALDVNQIQGTVILDPGVRLQVRRTPSTTGESLGLLDSGTQIVVLQQTTVKGADGQPDTIWLFIRHQTGTGTIDGWVISTFIALTFKGRVFDIKEVPSTTEPPVGSVRGDVAAFVPTAKPGVIAVVDKIDPTANLQFRRQPNATAESLGLVPAGTELSVLGRNGDGNWLYVSFNGVEGWVNAFYCTVKKDGKLYKIADLKNQTDQVDIAASVTPGPSPTPTPTS
jgi:uncharacterized protein YgiM (DUF1202 family)